MTEKKAFFSERLLPFLLIAVGILVRVWQLGDIPSGIHQDEAFSAYEAYCLLETGMDSAGYAFPVYFTAWGSGMNALEIYLMMPFIALFGLVPWAIRMPQVIVACLTLPAFYGTVSRLFDRRTGLIALALLVSCPWHILLSRWGLESNLAPGFLIFGLYFMVRGRIDARFYPLSALLYGLSLYCYATIWLIVPFIVLFQAILLFRRCAMRPDRFICLSAVILLIMALPLLYYLLVNSDRAPEIRTAFFSIPRMCEARIDEVSLANIAAGFKKTARMLVLQTDGEIMNAMPGLGLYYPFALPFILLGAFSVLRSVFRKSKAGIGPLFVLIQLIPSLIQGLMIDGNIIRLNSIHLPMLMLETLGIVFALNHLPSRLHKRFPALLAALYLLSFACCIRQYFGPYGERIAITCRSGLGEAVNRAKELAGEDGTIDVLGTIEFPRILFYDRTPPQSFRDTIRYTGPTRYRRAESFTRYRFQSPQPGSVIIADFAADLSAFTDYTREDYGWITVLHR